MALLLSFPYVNVLNGFIVRSWHLITEVRRKSVDHRGSPTSFAEDKYTRALFHSSYKQAALMLNI